MVIHYGQRVLVVLVLLVLVVGCSSVGTYTVEQDRVDQSLVEGNQGFLMGAPKEPLATDRKLTRKTYVAEVELGAKSSSKKKKVKTQAAPKMVMEVVQQPEDEAMPEGLAMPMESMEDVSEAGTYTVQPNDTLQKISLKVYGTTKKWETIYKANAKELKSPDRIYAGQVLVIPGE